MCVTRGSHSWHTDTNKHKRMSAYMHAVSNQGHPTHYVSLVRLKEVQDICWHGVIEAILHLRIYEM